MNDLNGYNPYAAPTDREPPSVVHFARPQNWFLWILGAIVFESGLTAVCLYKDVDGQACAIVSGAGLAVGVFFAARIYARRMAFFLAQILNLCVWGSMLVTVLLILPSTNNGQLSQDDINIFVAIWLGGVFVVTLLVLLFGLRIGSGEKATTVAMSKE